MWRIHRNTARVLPVDADGRVLLLLGRELLRRGDHFWFTVGGAAERGETLTEAGAREMREEVGVTIDPASLGAPIGTSTIEFTLLRMRFVQDQTYYALPMAAGATVSFAHTGLLERATIVRHAWLRAEDVENGPERLGDPELPRYMRAAATVHGAG